MSTTPGGMQYPGFPEPPPAIQTKKSSRGRIVAIAAMVVALVAAVAVGRASATRSAGQPVAAPATVTSMAPPGTVTATTTATATVTAAPTTITAPPVSVTTTVTVTEAAAGPSTTIKDGINLVGVDVQPGTYRSENGDCYWARLSGTGGSLDDIIANSNGATVVTIDPSDRAFESRRCAPWTQVG